MCIPNMLVVACLIVKVYGMLATVIPPTVVSCHILYCSRGQQHVHHGRISLCACEAPYGGNCVLGWAAVSPAPTSANVAPGWWKATHTGLHRFTFAFFGHENDGWWLAAARRGSAAASVPQDHYYLTLNDIRTHHIYPKLHAQ